MDIASYKEKQVVAVEHTRSARVVIETPYKGLLSINFVMEELTETSDGRIITIPSGNVIGTYSEEPYRVYDLETGEPTKEKTTDSILATLLYSKFMALENEKEVASKEV